jgi:DNA-binding response OmpR family regulator
VASRDIRRILVVEDNASLRAAIARLGRGWGATVLEAATVREALSLLSPSPDLIVADVRLPDGSAHTVFREALASWPKPLTIAMSGAASPEEAFELSQLGVRAYLAKPLTLSDLALTVDAIRAEPPSLDPVASAAVGQVPLLVLQERLREVMLHQALALSGGNRAAAARLLEVSRQAVQQILRGSPREPAESEPAEDS